MTEQVPSEERAWEPISTAPQGVVVETCIDAGTDKQRNEQKLIRDRNLWFFPDRSMYVYYTPTHWRRS